MKGQESVTSACPPSGSQIITTLGGLEGFYQSRSYSDQGWSAGQGSPCLHSSSQYSLGKMGTSLGENQGSTGVGPDSQGMGGRPRRREGGGTTTFKDKIRDCELEAKTASSSGPTPKAHSGRRLWTIANKCFVQGHPAQNPCLGCLPGVSATATLPPHLSFQGSVPRLDARMCP